MTDPEPLKISTPQEMVVGTQFFTCHGTKTNIVILAADDKASLLLITSSVSSVLDCSVEPENIHSRVFLYHQGERSGLGKLKKDGHQCKSELPSMFIFMSQSQLM